MAVLATDLKFFLSTVNYGGAITATQATGGNVFDAFTGSETSAGTTVYACVYAKNGSAQTAFATKVYVNSETAFGTVNATIALGNAAVSATETATADETTAPVPALTFVEATGEANGLLIGDLTAGQYKAVWIKLVVPAATTANNNYTIELGFYADTGV